MTRFRLKFLLVLLGLASSPMHAQLAGLKDGTSNTLQFPEKSGGGSLTGINNLTTRGSLTGNVQQSVD